MKPDVKKLLILNLPYLIFVYLFAKCGEAYRLAAGADLSGKLLHFADGFAAAFANPLPSLSLFDLCIGIAGAVIVRLVVYCKSKNVKKYRKGMEYGSARWGTAKDIAPYIDPKFENNILLTQTERLTMTGRPKDPKTARNKNVLVIGEGVIIGLSQATSRKRGPRRLSPILVTGGENNGAGFSAHTSTGIFLCSRGCPVSIISNQEEFLHGI